MTINGTIFWQQTATAACTAGAVGGFITGSGMTWLGGSSFAQGLKSGLIGAGMGAAIGAAIGGTVQGISAKSQGRSFWTGKSNYMPPPDTQPIQQSDLQGVSNKTTITKGDSQYEIIPRNTPGGDQAVSYQIIEMSSEGYKISRLHIVIKDGVIIHQHQIHISVTNPSNLRTFPEQWNNFPTIPPHLK